MRIGPGLPRRSAAGEHPAIQKVISTGRLLIQLNRHQISARRGVIISGMSGTGKTTALTQLGRAHELATRKRHPRRREPAAGHLRHRPARRPPRGCWRSSSPASSAWSSRLGANLTDITNAVCSVAAHTHVDLVLVDEIHNISLATRTGAEVSDQLKYFAERLPATFIYAGVEVEAQACSPAPAAARSPGGSPSSRPPVRLRHRRPARRLARPDRHLWIHAAAAPPPARHPGRHGRVPLPPHRRHDRQPVPAGPRRGHPGHRDGSEQITEDLLEPGARSTTPPNAAPPPGPVAAAVAETAAL